MGSKTDGFLCNHLYSDCCQRQVRFISLSNGHSTDVWCPGCGTYLYKGKTEGLIALWLGKLEIMEEKIVGYLPKWLKSLGIRLKDIEIGMGKYLDDLEYEIEKRKIVKPKVFCWNNSHQAPLNEIFEIMFLTGNTRIYSYEKDYEMNIIVVGTSNIKDAVDLLMSKDYMEDLEMEDICDYIRIWEDWEK